MIFSILVYSAITTSYHYIYCVEYVFLDCFKLKVGHAKNGHIISLAATINLCVSSPDSTRCHLYYSLHSCCPSHLCFLSFVTGHDGGTVPSVYGMSSHLITFCSMGRLVYSTNPSIVLYIMNNFIGGKQICV